MKKLVILFFILKTTASLAQQNYFNVPSFEMTKKNKAFFQQQLNVNDSLESNTTVDWGLGNNLELGMNIYGVQFNNPLTRRDDTDGKFEHLTLINLQKVFEINESFFLGFGGQYGYRHSRFKLANPAGNVYAALGFHHPKKYNLAIGPWAATYKYLGGNSQSGVQAGGEWYIDHNNLAIVIDTITGSSPLSVTVFGFNFHLSKSWILSTGYQVPNSRVAAHALVFELTFKDDE